MTSNSKIMDAELESLSLEDLLNHHERLEKVINRKAQQERQDAWATLERLEKFDQRERLGGTSKLRPGAVKAGPLKGRKIVPKFYNPAHPAETWAGRGRKPAWVMAALDAGKTLDDLRINRGRVNQKL